MAPRAKGHLESTCLRSRQGPRYISYRNTALLFYCTFPHGGLWRDYLCMSICNAIGSMLF